MMRALALILCLAGAAALPAETPSRWQSVTLFDWVYSGEAPYETLKRAAELAGDQGWVARRLEAGEKVPQASARELAQKLAAIDGLDPEVRAALKTLFADESRKLGLDSQAEVSRTAEALDQSLDEASKKLDALEASLNRNSYGKGSGTGVTLNLYGGYRLDDPAGMVQGQEHVYPAGGLEAALAGSIGKVNYTFSLGAEYYYNHLNQSSVGAPTTQALDTDPEVDNGTLDAGVSFQFPLGTRGGLDISLGTAQDLNLSPLLFSSIEPINRDAFFVDVLAPYRTPKIVKTMEMNYPAQTLHFRGLTVKKTGYDTLWPFTLTQFAYTQDWNWYEPWDAKINTLALRVDEEIKAQGDWLDGGSLYAMVQDASNDQDQMTGDGITPQSPGALVQNAELYQQRSESAGLGAQLRGSNGTLLHIDAAYSSYTWKWDAPYAQDYTDGAFVATVVQPVGPLNFALEMGQAGPHFLSSPRVENRIQYGATQDSIAFAYSSQGIGMDSVVSEPKGTKPPALAWISMMNQPDVLTNNNRQVVLKSEWHGSWISAGAYDGAQMQINATDAYVWTTPYIEGNQNDGYGWFRMFGNTFASGTAVAPNASGAGQSGGVLQQNLFNLPTDGKATVPGGGAPIPVHWQQLSQYGDYETEFTTLLSRNGAGDGDVLPDSAKSLNYLGANLDFDIAALLGRPLPLDVTVIGEYRDLDSLPGLPSLAGTSLFNQQFEVAFLNWGLSDTTTILATAGFETWKTQQSDFPVDMQIREYGVGADLKEDPLVTGLVFNLRASQMRFDDLNIGSRELSLTTLSLGCTLSY